ncbi:hypothetical protein LMG24238_06884 [Paraburkholderia sediminicola]|uniref:Uncharacterized protein n=1 Tax=Paraburkholderia sediminicola TaxID=458836 RepID=A0A6J5CQI7_9BURK|nr:hypothetical protein LMG24238_06884 [Paraburkholderia sediminicola]
MDAFTELRILRTLATPLGSASAAICYHPTLIGVAIKELGMDTIKTILVVLDAGGWVVAAIVVAALFGIDAIVRRAKRKNGRQATHTPAHRR